MPKCSMLKNNGIFESNKKNIDELALDPQFIFVSRQRYNGLLSDIKNTLNQISYAFVKGEALSIMAYGKPGMRYFSDIDILLPRHSVRELESELIVKGYKTGLNTLDYRNQRVLCISSSHQLMPYRKVLKGLNLEIDINFDVFWGEYDGKRIDIESFLSDTIDIKIYGCSVKTLTPMKAMIHLILHHYKEMNSIYHIYGHNCIKYSMFRDVYYLWKNNKESFPLGTFIEMVSNYEIIPYAFYVLFFTNWIFKDNELQKYVDALKTNEGEALLNMYGLTNNERKQWKVDFHTRLKTDNLSDFIKGDLTIKDIEKIERNRRIFG